VPVCFAGAEVVKDDVSHYSERCAYKGGINRILGKDVMPIVLNYMGNPVKISG
jgi:2,3-bisphosphoglycerate-independent phosphoglycerate mutase